MQTQSLISFKQVQSHSLFSFEQEEVQTQSLSRIRNKAHTLCTLYGNILYQEQEQTQSLFSYMMILGKDYLWGSRVTNRDMVVVLQEISRQLNKDQVNLTELLDLPHGRCIQTCKKVSHPWVLLSPKSLP